MLELPAALYAAIRQHGEEAYPHECCGVLLGHATDRANQVCAAVRAGNTRTDAAHNRYNIAPAELIRIQREGRKEGFDVIGFYHSHPDHPPRWSQTDFAEAHWLGCSYVITAVAEGQALETNSFRLEGATEENKQFRNEPVVILAPSMDELSAAAGRSSTAASRC